MKNALAIIILSTLAFLTGSFLGNIFPQSTVPEESAFGSTNAVGGTSYYLYGSGVAAADTSITLTSFKQPVNQYPLTITDFGSIGYLTLEPGNSLRQEFISFSGVTQNADGTATLTGVTRGLAPVSPYTASTTIRKAHGGGTIAVLSNPPQFYERFANKDNTQYITGAWGFQGTAPTSTVCATANELCNKTYVDASIIAGGVQGSNTVPGIFMTATALQAASSTASTVYSGLPYLHVIPASIATSSPGTAGLWSVMTNNAGKIAQAFLDWTQNIAFSGTNTHSGLETFSGGFLSTASSTFSANLYTATTTTSTNTIGKGFGGTGADGALTLTTGTTTINLASASVVEKNYSSISITGDAALEFSNPASTGSIVIFKSQGNVTITSSKQIYLVGLGSAGGAAGNGSNGDNTQGAGTGGGGGASMTAAGSASTGSGGNNQGNDGTVGSAFSKWLYSQTAIVGGAGGAGSGAAAGGTSPAISTTYAPTYLRWLVMPGSGGGGGESGDTAGNVAKAGSDGGRGAGAFFMEVGGNLNITGTINANGTPSASVADALGGCGGGGGGGSIQIIYNYLTANSGTYAVTGGASGGTCTNAGGAGANGYSSVTQNTSF